MLTNELKEILAFLKSSNSLPNDLLANKLEQLAVDIENSNDLINRQKCKILELEQEIKKNNEVSLKKQREKFLSIIKSMRDGLCVLDEVGNITFANPVAEKLIGYDILLGENFLNFLEAETQDDIFNLKKLTERDEEHKNTASRVSLIRNKKGKKIPIRCSWSNLTDELGRQIGQIVVFNDYSIELETQRRLEQAKDRAVEMSKLKSEFLATMSHEIRTPLNGIVSLVSLLEMSELDEEQKEDIADLKACSSQLQELISNILDLSKIEAGKMYLDYQKFSIQHLLNDINRIFSPQLEYKEILFIPELIGQLPKYISADYTRLKQVLVNLVGNAIKFTAAGGCFVLLLKGKNISESNYQIDFSVIDTGVGIPETSLESLFNPFIQADGSITRNFGGTGLGLSICKNLIDLMGGEIKVKSREGIGSVFTFNLLVEEPNFSQESLARLKAVKLGPSKEKERSATILVVDDNQVNLSTTTRFLKKYGLNTLSASSGDEALKLVSKGEIDVILLDLHMPTMSGYEVTRCIRESDSDMSKIPIIALTADVLEGTKQACVDAGFTGFISKPVMLSDLVKSIDSILGELYA